MGASLTLIPCAPLATLLASAAAAGSVGEGALLGGVFGVGTVLTPMLLLIPAASSIGARMVQEQRWLADWLRLGAALVLAIIAAVRIGYFDPSLALPLTLAAALVVLLRHVRLRGTAASPGATGQPVTLHFPRHR
jgi:sulfite exporter TauE/SafE